MEINYYQEEISKLKNTAFSYVPTLITSIFIFVIFYVLANYIKSYIINKSNGVNQEYSISKNLVLHEIAWFMYYSILVIGIVFLLINLGVNVAAILTLLGTLGLAFGLAMQDSIKNLISGVYIMLYGIYNIGDIIEITTISSPNTAVIGKVLDFNLLYTTIAKNTQENTYIPNSIIQTNILSNRI